MMMMWDDDREVLRFTGVDGIHSSEVSSIRTRTNYGIIIIEKMRNEVTFN